MAKNPITSEKSQPKSTHPLEHVIHIGIDKLRLSFSKNSFDEISLNDLNKKLDELKKREGTRAHSSKGKPFKNRISVKVGNHHILVECSNDSARYPYGLACEFNPNDYLKGSEGNRIGSVVVFLKSLLGYDAPRLISEACVSRLDLNVDFDKNVLDGTLIQVKGKRGGSTVMCNLDGHGALGSLYIGVPDSNRQVVVYDKAAQVLKEKLAPHSDKILTALTSKKSDEDWDFLIKKLEDAMPKPVWRMEVRCRPKPALPVFRMLELADAFDDIRLMYLPPDRKPFDDSLGRTFVRLAAQVGIPAALQALHEHERRKFNTAVAKLPEVDWWNAEVLRECIDNVLNRLTPLFETPKPKLRSFVKEQAAPARSLALPHPCTIGTVPPKPKGGPAPSAQQQFTRTNANVNAKPTPVHPRPAQARAALTRSPTVTHPSTATTTKPVPHRRQPL